MPALSAKFPCYLDLVFCIVLVDNRALLVTHGYLGVICPGCDGVGDILSLGLTLFVHTFSRHTILVGSTSLKMLEVS